MNGLNLHALEEPATDGVDSPTVAAGSGLAGARSNALSNKLTSVLSTSYADSEIRDALGLLDGRGVTNNAEARRNLRIDAQKEVIKCNAQIVDDFGRVAEQLQRVGAMLTTLNNTCNEMRRHISLAKQESAPMLEEATVLIANKEENETKQEILNAFNKHFILSDEDLTNLTSSVEPVNERFFLTLTRVKQIHNDCEVLLGSENQRLGLELMEQTSRNLDAGFKKLYAWIQREFKGLDLEDPHISGSIRRALRVLSERPTLFQNCLDFFAEAREQTLSSAFQLALTESTGPSAKAIEFSTHDLLRYVGDMLAWVHSTTVSEKEALEGLFIADADEIAKSMKAGKTSEPWSRIAHDDSDSDSDSDPDGEPTFNGREALNSLVSRNLAGVCQTLQSRIETAVRNCDEPTLIYKVLNLLTFYHTMFAKQVGPDTVLTNLISTLSSFTTTHFTRVVEDDHHTATADATASLDLSPPVFLTSALHQLVDLVRAKGPGMTPAESMSLSNTLLSVPLSTSAGIAETIADPRRRAIFALNYLCATRSALAVITDQLHVPDTVPSLEQTSGGITLLKDELTNQLTHQLLSASGVSDTLDILRHDNSDSPSSSSLPSNAALSSAAAQLDAFLPSALIDVQDSMKQLLERSLSREVVTDAVETFCTAFEELERLLEDVEARAQRLNANVNGEGAEAEEAEQSVSLRELYPRTSAEVRALLS